MKLGSTVLFALLAVGSLSVAQTPEPNKAPKPDLPLAAPNWLEFSTEEGTWMSLDLSPDGKTIVFELLGDLYTMPSTGGDAKQIVGGAQFDFQPKFSPDGKKIVFLSDRSGAENIWTVNADGTDAKAITRDSDTCYISPAWTPDGKFVVASRAVGYLAPYALSMYDVAGGLGMPVASFGGGGSNRERPNRMGVSPSRDGKYFYFSQRTGSWTYDAKFPLWQVYRVDRKTGDIRQITSAQGSGMRPMVSPDGKKVVYFTRYRTGTALKMRDLETGQERWVAYPVDRDEQESRATRDTMPGYAYTPDGTALIMPHQGKIQKLDLKSGKFENIPFKVKVKTPVSPTCYFEHPAEDSPTVQARIIRDPLLSPDGKTLVFAAFRRLWKMDWPGGAPVQLISKIPAKIDGANQLNPSWSPDSKSVVFATWNGSEGHLARVSVDTGEVRLITRTPGYYTAPKVAPDGQSVYAFSSLTESGMDYLTPPESYCLRSPDEEPHAHEIGGSFTMTTMTLSKFPIHGGTGEELIDAFGGDLQFVQGDERMYLAGYGTLASLRKDGMDSKTILDISGSKGFGQGQNKADMIKISPKGDQVAVSSDNRLYVFSMPAAGLSTLYLTINGLGPSAIPVANLSPGAEYIHWHGDQLYWSIGNKIYWRTADGKVESKQITVELPRHKPTDIVALRGARIISMKGDEVIEKGDIVLSGNRIQAIGKFGTVPIPKGAKVLDLAGKTISPGFVDVHSHWFGRGEMSAKQSWGYLANLAYGVTTNRDPQAGSSDIYDYAELIEIGEAIGPRIYTTGPGVFTSSGVETADRVKDLIKRYKDAYNTYTLKQYVTGDRKTRQWVLQACREFGITPTTEGALDFKMGLTEMIDGFSGHEHAMPIVPFYQDVAQLMAKQKVFYTPTLLVTYGAPSGENYWYQTSDVAKNERLMRFVPPMLIDSMARRRGTWNLPEEYGFKAVAESCAKVVRAGGRVCLGSHGQLQGLGAHWELWSMASGGMTSLEALRCATIFGAEAIGMAKDLGSLEPGKLADIIVFDKNPLTNIYHTDSIRYVVKNGEVFDGHTMDRILPTPRKLPKAAWEALRPEATLPR